MSQLPAKPLPFDPALAGDDGVLSIDWQLSDHRLETLDSTKLTVTLKNHSSYFEAEHLETLLRLVAADGSDPGSRPDGNTYLALTPARQIIERIAPGKTHIFEYLVATRGPQAGLYAVEVEVSYQLVYVYRELCRPIKALARLPLRIHGGSDAPDGETLRPLPPSSEPQLERLSISQRKLHMSEQVEQVGEHGHARRRELHAIEREVDLPGGGKVIVSYRLVKGSHEPGKECRPSHGWTPGTNEIESYFSTSDEAEVELTMRNASSLHLRHLYVNDIHLFDAKPDWSNGGRADEGRLPDGNFLFQVMPGNVYFGHLDPGEVSTRYLGLVARGIRDGRFLINFDVKYEIVDGNARVGLPLIVNPD